MLPNWLNMFTIAVAAARFSGVWFSTLAAQLYTIALAANAPLAYRNDAAYRAGTFSVPTLMANPTTATAMGAAMWKPRSPRRSLETATANDTAAPKR